MLGQYLGAGASTTKLLLHLNGNSTDSSGNGNNGTDTNITYSLANGRFGQGAGTSTGKIVTSSPLTYTELRANATISVWFKMNSFVNNGHFWGIGAWSGSARSYIMFRCITRTTNNWELYGSISAPGAYMTVKTSIDSDTGWNNGVFTYDGSRMKFYINGVLVSDVASTFNTDGTNTVGFYLLDALGGGAPANSASDECIIEKVTWSAEKVKKYYTMAKGRFGIL